MNMGLSKSQLKKKLESKAKQLVGDGNIWGLDFDEVISGSKKITAKGDFDEIGSVDFVGKFDNKARLKSITMSVDYYNFDGRLVQGYSYSNYNKHKRSLKKDRYESKYIEAQNYISEGGEKMSQKGVDLMEELPGISNVYLRLIGADVDGYYVS